MSWLLSVTGLKLLRPCSRGCCPASRPGNAVFTEFRYQRIRGAGRRVERERNAVLIAEDGAQSAIRRPAVLSNPGELERNRLPSPDRQVIDEHATEPVSGTLSGAIAHARELIVGTESTAVTARAHAGIVSGLNVVRSIGEQVLQGQGAEQVETSLEAPLYACLERVVNGISMLLVLPSRLPQYCGNG